MEGKRPLLGGFAPSRTSSNAMTDITLYNTLSRRKEPFTPLDPDRVTMYVCGPTVWNYAHIGNARPAVVFDVLFRLLRQVFGADHVVYARNITDVDDKINKAAADQDVDISIITQRYTEIYRQDVAALGVLPPSLEPTVTGHMGAIVDMIARLLDKGHAYAAEGHVLFDVASFGAYGALSGRNLDDMIAGARVEVAPYKRNPHDFVLWKPSKAHEPRWPAPFGEGRPGWHIECSAMIEANLGRTIDIHGGGHDLVFPHHENEIAQGTCAHDGELYARYWMHNGFLTMDSDKMSKSLGNVQLIHDLVGLWPAEALRLALLTAHYRAPLDWTEDLLRQSVRTLDRLYGALARVWGADAAPGDAGSVLAALCDDLNTPEALAALSALATEANKAKPKEFARARADLLAAGGLLGLLGQSPHAWFEARKPKDAGVVAEIEGLVQARAAARAAKDWAEADRLRVELTAREVEVQDGVEGSAWRYVG
jgi:cysteinyl-tRNA synthetase